MTLEPFGTLIPLLLGILTVQPAAFQQPVTRLVVRNGIVWRIPLAPGPPRQPVGWAERKGPGCISAGSIRRAFLSNEDQVDFVLADRNRVRAKFDRSCAALDFYGGFYLQVQDEFLCAKRDAIHSRMGASCTIEKFKRLEPQLNR